MIAPEQRRFAQLQAVDVEGVLPAVRADLSDENVTRSDESVRYGDRWVAQGTRGGSSSNGSLHISIKFSGDQQGRSLPECSA